MRIKFKDNYLNLIICKNYLKRLKGFMFKKNINTCLCFPRCNSIHTFFMRENIDVIMTDKNYKILYIYNNFSKNKIILPKKNVYYVFETQKNTNTYKIFEKVEIINE